jgi:hypothetical protein
MHGGCPDFSEKERIVGLGVVCVTRFCSYLNVAAECQD